MFNEGIWNAQKKSWEGSAIPRTMEGDEANYTAFLLGMPSLQAAGCNTQRNLKLPRAWVVLCILHLTMAMRRLLGGFVDGEARLVTPALRRNLQVLLAERRAGWSVYGSASPDGEETAHFFEALQDIARCLGIKPSTAKYKAIANMWDPLQALYCTYQGPNPLKCAGQMVKKNYGPPSTDRGARVRHLKFPPPGAMRQRILGLHTPMCHTSPHSSVLFPRCTAAQTSSESLQVAADCVFALAICTLRSPRTHHPPTVPVSL